MRCIKGMRSRALVLLIAMSPEHNVMPLMKALLKGSFLIYFVISVQKTCFREARVMIKDRAGNNLKGKPVSGFSLRGSLLGILH